MKKDDFAKKVREEIREQNLIENGQITKMSETRRYGITGRPQKGHDHENGNYYIKQLEDNVGKDKYTGGSLDRSYFYHVRR